MRDRRMAAGLAGLLGVALNVVAVGALQVVPHTYKPGDVAAWLAETRAAPGNAHVSAWAFTVGLVALAAFAAAAGGWARRAARRDAWTVGAVLFGGGAMLDAAGTQAAIAVLHLEDGPALALLWMTLLLDSAFNLLLGLGLLCFAAAQSPEDGWPGWLRWLALAAGLASLPVGLQYLDDGYARLLALSGPLWLAWVTASSVALLRGRAEAG